MRLGAVIVSSLVTGCYVGGAAALDAGVDASPDEAAAATPDGGDASDGGLCAAPADAGDLPCDVSAVFQTRCQKCHVTPPPPPPNDAPFPLRTYEDLVSPYGSTMLRWQRVAQVIEPNALPHMPPATEPQPTAAELDTLRAWFDACAPGLPEGTGCDVGEVDP